MSHVSSGSAATSAQYNAHDDRLTALEANTVASGGTSANVGYNEVSTTVSSTGSVTVSHGMGWTPTVVTVQLRGNPSNSGPYITYVSTVTSSTFIVFFGQWTSSGSWSPAHSGQSVTFDWVAYK